MQHHETNSKIFGDIIEPTGHTKVVGCTSLTRYLAHKDTLTVLVLSLPLFPCSLSVAKCYVSA